MIGSGFGPGGMANRRRAILVNSRPNKVETRARRATGTWMVLVARVWVVSVLSEGMKSKGMKKRWVGAGRRLVKLCVSG